MYSWEYFIDKNIFPAFAPYENTINAYGNLSHDLGQVQKWGGVV
jgi:hypothetical protein